jgi:DNA-binding NarL/FixJ family response regulator
LLVPLESRGTFPHPRFPLYDPRRGEGNPSCEGLAPSRTSARLARVRVVIADDHRLVLDGIRRALEADGSFEIVGETQSGMQVLPLVAREKPDLVLLDVRMPNMDGLACLDEIRRRHPETKVVMLSASTSTDLIETALRRGASAYVIKSVDPDDLPATLRQALEGNLHTAVGLESEKPTGAKALGLTDREVTILGALARGLSNDEIAKEFWVAPQTVKFHLTNIYRKLGVKNRTEATRLAYQHGLVESPIYADE